MPNAAATPTEEQGRVDARRSLLLLLSGPAALLVGSALVLGGLFLPWHTADAHALVGDPYPSNFQPVVPLQALDGAERFWLVLAAVPSMATLVCLGLGATPRLRRPGLLRGAAIGFGFLTLLAAGVGSILLILYYSFLSLEGTALELLDWGYFVSGAGYLLLVAGVILLMTGQTQVSQLVRLGRLRAP